MNDDDVVYNVDEFRCNARGNHYVSNVRNGSLSRARVYQATGSRAQPRAGDSGPDVSATSIDM